MRTLDLPDYFTRRQALALGFTDREVAAALASGSVERLKRGRFRVVVDLLDFEARRAGHLAEVETVLLDHAGGYVASHLSAAMAHGLVVPLAPLDAVHVTADTAGACSRRSPGGVQIHHGESVRMSPTVVRGLPCTPLPRTLADCLRWHWPAIAVPLVDDALARGLCRVEDVVAELAAQRRWRGKVQARSALAVVDGRRESWLESRACVAMWRVGIELPEPQVTVLDERGRFVGRVDGLWVEDNTVLEIDGKSKYLIPDRYGVVDPDAVLAAQEARQERLEGLGLEVARVDLPVSLDEWGDLTTTVMQARRRGRYRRFTGRLVLMPSTGLVHRPPTP